MFEYPVRLPAKRTQSNLTLHGARRAVWCLALLCILLNDYICSGLQINIDPIYGRCNSFLAVFLTTSVSVIHHPWCASPSVPFVIYNATYSV